MHENPLKNVEDKKAQFDMGLMAIRVYKGALSEADSRMQAFFATVAFFAGMFRGWNDDFPEDKDD